jgi:formylglycine-generating enzyme required for sulfatase activity
MAQLSIAKHPQKIHYFAESLHPSNLVLKPMNMILIGAPNPTTSQHTDLAAIWEEVLQQLLPSSRDLFKPFGKLIAITDEQVVVAMKSSTMQSIASGKIPELTKVFSNMFGRSMVIKLDVLGKIHFQMDSPETEIDRSGKIHFQMGSPETEIDRSEDESPQHQVTVQPFFMSEFLIPQVYWMAVADTMPQVDIPLEKSPSRLPLKGEDRTSHPVTDVNWFEAVEFCKRLSKHSGRTYRLPTEAEWEYACRAGTTTPFHFGETITTDLANYRGKYHEDLKWSTSYGGGTNGIYREQTTCLDTFPPNAFGLYDMHGNVWEWCQDHWHDNYKGAPRGGTAWLSDDQNAPRVLRGGSWFNIPRDCRSTSRGSDTPNKRDDVVGFRVVCEIPRTL